MAVHEVSDEVLQLIFGDGAALVGVNTIIDLLDVLVRQPDCRHSRIHQEIAHLVVVEHGVVVQVVQNPNLLNLSRCLDVERD